MTIATLDLASLLCSRLCHDLLSPVGALTNGLELLAEERDPEMRQKCMELLEQSATSSANKLRFFRLAFGAAGGFGDMVPVNEPRALVDALVAANPRISVAWALADDMLPKAAVKTLLNLSMIGIEALVRGGNLDIAGELRANETGGEATELVIRASGPRIAFDPLVAQALAGTLAPADLSSRTAPAAMLYQLAQGLGGGFQTHVAADALVLGAVLPVR
jgi:histidine phosphotransferase ChpT